MPFRCCRGTCGWSTRRRSMRSMRPGRKHELAHGQHLHLTVRPEAPLQILLTGHMDTVFAVDHPFQALTWLDAGTLGGPGVADMKSGIAVMLAALRAVEASPFAASIGYEVVINSDEEVGSLASAALLAKAAQGKRAALTYEPSALARRDHGRRAAGERQFQFHGARQVGPCRAQSRGRAQRTGRRGGPGASVEGGGRTRPVGQPGADRWRKPQQCRARPRHPAGQSAPRDDRGPGAGARSDRRGGGRGRGGA